MSRCRAWLLILPVVLMAGIFASLAGGCAPGTVSTGKLVVSPKNPTANRNQTVQFSADLQTSSGVFVPVTNNATWTASPSNVATINSSGLAAAVGPGTATITATHQGLTDSTTLTVQSNQADTSINVVALGNIAAAGEVRTVTMNASTSAGASAVVIDFNLAPGGPVDVVASPQPCQISVSLRSGTCTLPSLAANQTVNLQLDLRSTTQGSFPLNASIRSAETDPNTANNSVLRFVDWNPPRLNAIQITPQSVTIAHNATLQLTVTGIFSDGLTRDLTNDPNIQYTESNALFVGLIGTAGLVRGTNLTPNPRTATITATHGPTGFQSVATITVDPVPQQPPVANFTFNCTGLNCTFDGSSSNDPDGGAITLFNWNFGDGAAGAGTNVQHIYSSAGTNNVQLTVTDDEGDSATNTQQVTLTAPQPLNILTTQIACGVGNQCNQSIAVTGGTPPYTFSSAGLPAWLLLDTTTGGLTGTPQAGDGGMTNFTATVTDSSVPTLTDIESIAVDTLEINIPSPLPDGFVGQSYSFAFSAGVTAQGFSISGNVPPGLTLDLGTGTLSGIPQLAGTYSFTIGAHTVRGANAFKTFQLTVQPGLAITPSAASVAVGGQQQFTAHAITDLSQPTSGPDLTNLVIWSSSDAGIASMSNAAGSEGLASGITASPNPVTITATLPTGIFATASLTVTAAGPNLEPNCLVGSHFGGSLTSFKIDRTTGILTPAAGHVLFPPGNAIEVAAHPGGNFVAVLVSSGGNLEVRSIGVDPNTCALNPTASDTKSFVGFGNAITNRNDNFFVTNGASNFVHYLRLDPTTGTFTTIGTFPTGPFPGSLVATHNGNFLYTASGSILTQHSIQNNGLPIVGTLPFAGASINEMLVAEGDNDLIFTDPVRQGIEVVHIDSTTGVPDLNLRSFQFAGINIRTPDIFVAPNGTTYFITFALIPSFPNGEVRSHSFNRAPRTFAPLITPQAIQEPGCFHLAHILSTNKLFGYVNSDAPGSPVNRLFEFDPTLGGLRSVGPSTPTQPNTTRLVIVPGP